MRLLVALALAGVIFWFVRRRRDTVTVLPGDPVSTLHGERLKKSSKRSRAALDAASRMLK